VVRFPYHTVQAKAAGADFVGLQELVAKVQGGFTGFDAVIAMPSTMAQVGRLGRILGPRGLMPNPNNNECCASSFRD